MQGTNVKKIRKECYSK